MGFAQLTYRESLRDIGMPSNTGSGGAKLRGSEDVMWSSWLVGLCAVCLLFGVAVPAQTTSGYDALVQKGKAQLQACNADLALASGESAIKMNPDSWEGYALAGGALMNLKRYREAAGNFSKAVDRAPQAKQSSLRDLRKQCFDKPAVESAVADSPAPSPTTGQAEVVLWKSIENSKRESDFEAYLQQYPKGALVALAKTRVQNLQKAQSGAIGVVFSALESAKAKGPGVTVSDVVPFGPASSAGLKRGDIILAVDGRTAQSGDQLTSHVASRLSGVQIEVDFLRDGKKKRTIVTVVERGKLYAE